jgi:hypothetical protein
VATGGGANPRPNRRRRPLAAAALEGSGIPGVSSGSCASMPVERQSEFS